MQNIQKMSIRGLELIKEFLIMLCCIVEAPPRDIALLEKVPITFTFSRADLISQFNWAVEKTAHQRYINWF